MTTQLGQSDGATGETKAAEPLDNIAFRVGLDWCLDHLPPAYPSLAELQESPLAEGLSGDELARLTDHENWVVFVDWLGSMVHGRPA